MAIGFFLRIPARTHQTSHGLVIPMSIFIVVSPAAFLAFNYLVYGHLIVAVDENLADRRNRRAKSPYSLIPPRLVKHVFVWSDISTFFVQISEPHTSISVSQRTIWWGVWTVGGTMEASVSTERVGDRILLGNDSSMSQANERICWLFYVSAPVGIILQGLSYVFFTVLSVHAFRRLRAKPSDPTFLKEGNMEHPARVVFMALWFSSVFILVR
jgi:RTA1 like protein